MISRVYIGQLDPCHSLFINLKKEEEVDIPECNQYRLTVVALK